MLLLDGLSTSPLVGLLLQSRHIILRPLELDLELSDRQLLVDTSLVLDALRSHSESKGREGFRFVVGGWRAVDDEGGARVTSEGLLEDTGEFGVSVGDVLGLKENDEDASGLGRAANKRERKRAHLSVGKSVDDDSES